MLTALPASSGSSAWRFALAGLAPVTSIPAAPARHTGVPARRRDTPGPLGLGARGPRRSSWLPRSCPGLQLRETRRDESAAGSPAGPSPVGVRLALLGKMARTRGGRRTTGLDLALPVTTVAIVLIGSAVPSAIHKARPGYARAFRAIALLTGRSNRRSPGALQWADQRKTLPIGRNRHPLYASTAPQQGMAPPRPPHPASSSAPATTRPRLGSPKASC